MTRSHLIILRKPYLDKILAGAKTIESRFSKNMIAPFGRITHGDKLFFKVSSGPVCAVGQAVKVEQFDDLTPEKIDLLRQKYDRHILGSDDYWQQKRQCPYGVLVWLKDIVPVEPVCINKKDWRAWVVLTKENNFGLPV